MSLRRLVFGLIALLLAVGASAFAQDEFLPPEEAFAFSAARTDAGEIALHYRIAPDYYLYRERFVFTLEPAKNVAWVERQRSPTFDAPTSAAPTSAVPRVGLPTSAQPTSEALGEPVFPPGQIKYDPTFERDMEVYVGELTIRIPVTLAQMSQTLKVVSQGCADAGLCYPPMENTVVLAALPAGASSAASAASNTDLSGLLAANDTGLARVIADSGWLTTVGVFFVLGLLLALTPCVLPMMPILSALIVGQRHVASPTRARGLALAGAYVLGMSVVYTLVGVVAGLSGVGLAAWLQTPWVLAVFAALLTLLALAMFDVFALQMPATVQTRLSTRLARVPGGHLSGALLMGAVSALIVGPCVAAPLAGALLYLSQTGDVALGGAALFAMAWGMGVPLLVVGASSGALLPRAGAWMDGVKHFFGVLLLATAWWMLMPLLASWLLMLGWALLAAVAAVLLRAFDALPTSPRAGALFAKATGLLLALVSVVLVLGVASGGRDPLQPLSHLAAGVRSAPSAPRPGSDTSFTRVQSLTELDALLARADRPVMLDFYADWCVACKEMERFTFSDPAVAAKLNRMLLVQADVTANGPQDRALLRRFRLFGPPGIIFFAPGGRELNARVVGFQSAERFAAMLAQVLND